MTALFGVALMIGIIMLLLWIAGTSIAANVQGREQLDPERRFGVVGRSVMAAFLGFGMAGMSSLYAGWPVPMVIFSSVLGAVGLVAVGIWFGPQEVE